MITLKQKVLQIILILSSMFGLYSTESRALTYSYFQHSAEIIDGKLNLWNYSPDEDDYVLYYGTPMDIIEGSNFHKLLSDQHKGIMLQSDQLLLVYIDKTDYVAFRGCDLNSYGSNDWIGGIKEVFTRDSLTIGESRKLPSAYFDVKEIIFSSGVLDIDDPDSYYAYARPRQIRIINQTSGNILEVELEDTAHFQVVELENSGPYEIFIEVLTVYPGMDSEDIAINSILLRREH